MLYTETKVVRHLESWCAERLGKHDSPEYLAYHEHFQRLLTTKRSEQQQEHSNSGRFGMSSAGGCLRANALRRAGVKGRPEYGDAAVTFEIGHLLECVALAVLQASGFKVTRMQEPVKLNPAFASAIDGVLEAGPVDLPYPLLVSCKTSSYKSSSPPRGKMPAKRYGFAALPLDGVRKAQLSWYAQAQLEMAATGIDRSLVLVLAKDMIAAFRGDDVFTQSGSLSWYAEMLERRSGVHGLAHYLVGHYSRHLDEPAHLAQPLYLGIDESLGLLPAPGDVESGWKGPNQIATGTFNPCFGCKFGGQPELCS